MNKHIIDTLKAPAAIGPYSQAIKFLNFVFTSGQIPIDPVNGEVVDGGIDSQTRQALNNLKEVLSAAGAATENVIKTTIFIKDMNDFALVNSIYSEVFKSEPPARSCVEVSRLPKDVLIEIEAIAYVPTE